MLTKKIQPLALTAALLGPATVAAQTGCYDEYNFGASYAKEDWVSNTVQEEQSCTPGQNGCPEDGKTIVTVPYNFQCVSNEYSQFCSDGGYRPGSENGKLAWTQQSGACTGVAGSGTPPTPSPWTGPGGSPGCPSSYASGTSYESGDVVAVARSGYTAVYECQEADWQHCATHDPLSHGGEQAWSLVGSCAGTISPTTAPNYSTLSDEGGCPGGYEEGASYAEGDRVSTDGLVFQCKVWPASEHCGQVGYEPDASSATEDWKAAWDVVGYCSGTIAPTVSPSFDAILDVGGCPSAWEEGTMYEVDDQVSTSGFVFKCTDPTTGRCGQAGYGPDVFASSEEWKTAWELAGRCSGTMVPTVSPSFDPANSVGACPEAWEAGDAQKYEEGDMVSVVVSETPERKVAFACRAWPNSGFCGQFSPIADGGDQGWEVAGGCEGTMGPTASPSFDAILPVAGGCAAEYDPSKTDYAEGDAVSVTVSTTPERKIQYECKGYPNTAYCNQDPATYGPGGTHWNMGWTQLGACTGTMVPTDAPTVYAGTCEYDQCRTVDGTEACAEGDAGCTCTGTDPNKVCTRAVQVEQCTTADVVAYDEDFLYFPGDVVRVGTKRYKCKAAPLHLWCRVGAYAPTGEDGGIWGDAWSADGTCAQP